MRRRASVWGRTRRLAVVTTLRDGQRDIQVDATRLATALGIGLDELLAEAEALAVQCQAAGATTLPAMAAIAAAAAGLDANEVRIEAERALVELQR